MDVELPNGKILSGVPEGTSKEDIMSKAISSGSCYALRLWHSRGRPVR